MSSTASSLLEELRAHTKVDCDTLDYEVAKALGPFVDCTSNQAIAYNEALKPQNEKLVKESVQLAKKLTSEYKDVPLAELAVEIIMVNLSLTMVPYLTGYVHTQTNPYYSYSTSKTVANAERIVSLYHTIDPKFDTARVCIKIPSSWEGLQACRILEKKKISTLATTLFCMEQAAVAGDAQCTYIAPYVNELQVHFVPSFTDNDKGFELSRAAQKYYKNTSSKTQVLPASLISIAEVMKLSGVDHITVSPPLLAELSTTPSKLSSAISDNVSWFDQEDLSAKLSDYSALLTDESAFRIAFTRSKNGANEGKLTSAINIFCDMQDKLEELVKKYGA